MKGEGKNSESDFDQEQRFDHGRAWLVAALNLLPNFGGFLGSLFDSYTRKNSNQHRKLDAILDELESLKTSRIAHRFQEVRKESTELSTGDPPPVFKEAAKVLAGKGFFGGKREIWHFDLSVDGRYLSVVRYGRTGAKIYSAKSGTLLQSIGGRPNGLYIHRPKALFSPNAGDVQGIAIGDYDKERAVVHIYWGNYAYRQKKRNSLYLSDDGDLDHLDSDGWSPDGRLYVSGSYSRRLDRNPQASDKYKLIVWDVFTDKDPWLIPIEEHTEGRHLCWHRNSRFLALPTNIGVPVVDLRRKDYGLLAQIDDRLSYLYSADFHPEKSWLGAANQDSFFVIDIEKEEIVCEFNDARDGKVRVERKYRYKDHSQCFTDFRYSISDIAFSPNGKLLATSDYFGNVVIRSCEDFSILQHYQMSDHLKGQRIFLKYLPSDEAGLTIDMYDENKKRGLWYIDSRRPGTPVKISEGMKIGDLKWCDVGVLASKFTDSVYLYTFE